jgi:hypothetical protein
MQSSKSRTCEDLESWTCEVLKSRTYEDPKPWICEARSRELVKIWNLEPMKTRSHEPAKPRNRKSAKFGNLLKFEFGSHGVWRFPGRGDSRISRKPSQRRRLKKSGFGVWTSGRLVNVWDVKDIHVHVHTRNIPWVRGYFQNVKVPSSPYKRGHEGTCKIIHNFWGLSSLWEIPCLLLRHLCTWTFWLSFNSCLGVSSEFSDAPQHWRPPCFSPKTTHDTTTEEVEEEHSSWDRSRRAPSSWMQWNLLRSRTF